MNELFEAPLMARARNIKPGLFQNEVLGAADPLMTLLFAGLWTIADRDGRLEDRPMRIKAQVFPYREGVDIESLLNWLAAERFIDRYEVGGHKCIWIVKFLDHQHPHPNEALSTLPPAPRDESGKKKKRARTTKDESASYQGAKDSGLSSESMPSDPSPLISDPPTPLPFPSARFGEAWEKWKRHRKEKRVKLTPTSVEQQFKQFIDWGEERAIAAIYHSITKGWQGVYEATGSSSNGSQAKTARAGGLRYDPAVHGDVTPLTDDERAACGNGGPREGA